MASPETTAPSTAPAPEPKTCRKCGETKATSPDLWPYRKGRKGIYAAHGGLCLLCEKQRKSEYESRRDKIALAVADVPAVSIRGDAAGKDKGKQRDAVVASKLDVAKALRAGARTLNEYAPSVLARVLEYVEDTESPHHLWALELLAQRILPRKLFEELGGQAAGLGSLDKQRPSFVIQVLPAQPAAGGRVFSGQAEVVDVQPLPMIPDKTGAA